MWLGQASRFSIVWSGKMITLFNVPPNSFKTIHCFFRESLAVLFRDEPSTCSIAQADVFLPFPAPRRMPCPLCSSVAVSHQTVRTCLQRGHLLLIRTLVCTCVMLSKLDLAESQSIMNQDSLFWENDHTF